MSKNPEISFSVIPKTEKLVNYFSNQFSALYDRDELAASAQSLIWCSYRKNFPAIGVSNGPTSDSGWGCMHRVGQMVVLHALRRILLRTSWRWCAPLLSKDPTPSSSDQSGEYLSLLELIGDCPEAVLSVHNITTQSGKSVGAQLSPDVLAFTLQKLWHHTSVNRGRYGWLQIVALNTSIVPIEDLRDAGHGRGDLYSSIHTSPESFVPSWQPLLVFVPCMIMPKTNCLLRSLLSFHQSVGFLGGHKGRAMWIFGYIADECFLALDPHVTQRSVQILHQDESYHTTSITRLPLQHLEGNAGSLALLFENESDLDAWAGQFRAEHLPMQVAKRCHCINLENRLPKMVDIVSYPSMDSYDTYHVTHNESHLRSVASMPVTSGKSLNKTPSLRSQSNRTLYANATTSDSVPDMDNVRMSSNLLYNDWFGRLYRFSDSFKQLFHRDSNAPNNENNDNTESTSSQGSEHIVSNHRLISKIRLSESEETPSK